MFEYKNHKIIDLTLPLSNELSGVKITQAKEIAKDGWNATTLELYSHCGTHMDAPKHFEVTDQTIDKLPVDKFISEAWILDLTHVQPKGLITVEDMAPIAQKIRKGNSLLLHTGWSKRIHLTEYRDALPRISKELALWLGKKQVNTLGVEPPSVADVNNLNEVTEIHNILLQQNIIIIEGLTNLDKIAKEKVTLIALPLKVKDGDGAPARVIALE